MPPAQARRQWILPAPGPARRRHPMRTWDRPSGGTAGVAAPGTSVRPAPRRHPRSPRQGPRAPLSCASWCPRSCQNGRHMCLCLRGWPGPLNTPPMRPVSEWLPWHWLRSGACGERYNLARAHCRAALAAICRDFGSLFKTLAVLWTQQRWRRVSGKISSSAFQKPELAIADGELGTNREPAPAQACGVTP